MTQLLPIDDMYQHDWLNQSAADQLENALARLNYREYAYRAGFLKRAPKTELYVPFEDGTKPKYRFGQHIVEYGTGGLLTELPALNRVRQRLIRETGESPNHCIIIRYSDGQQHHAPPHRDRQEGVPGNGAHDMAADTSFFVLSLGYPRLFQLLAEDQQVVWEERLAHGSLLRVTGAMNRELWHAVPRDPDQPADQPRYSAIFRTIRKPSK